MSNASGNTAKVVDQTYGGEGVTLTLYVYDELDRFVTVTRASLSTKELTDHLAGIHRRRVDLEDERQLMLFG